MLSQQQQSTGREQVKMVKIMLGLEGKGAYCGVHLDWADGVLPTFLRDATLTTHWAREFGANDQTTVTQLTLQGQKFPQCSPNNPLRTHNSRHTLTKFSKRWKDLLYSVTFKCHLYVGI